MIESKKELNEYLKQDALANGIKTKKISVFDDCVWKSIVNLRKREYYLSLHGLKRKLAFPLILLSRMELSWLSLKCGYTLPVNVFGKGLSIAHIGQIVINTKAKIGENCRIHEGVTIGSTNGQSEAPCIGNNVFIASGAKIIGNIFIANDVAIGANAVVVKSIDEPGTTWGGVPAKKISNNNSHSNLNHQLELD